MAKMALQTCASLLFAAALLFGSAGRLDWPAAWAFLGAQAVLSLLAFALLDPALLRERSRLLSGAQRWDALLSSAFFFFLFPATFGIAGFDQRYAWSGALPVSARAAAFVLFAIGYAIGFWAMYANPFFATIVCIQHERGHRAIHGGPYRYVRHPGYAGASLAHLALPVALGSWWALLPAVIGIILLVERTRLEDDFLAADLAGYVEYRSRVRWRLLPGLW